MDSEIIEPIQVNKEYQNEQIELYNEKYLGDDFELRNVEKILGRRIRVFSDNGDIKRFKREPKSYNKEFEMMYKEFSQKPKFAVEYLVKWEGLEYLESTWEPEKIMDKLQHLKDSIGMKACMKQKNLKRTFRKYDKEMYVEYELEQKKLNIREGSLKNNDIPVKVIGIRRSKGEIYVKVNWKSNSGEAVENSLVKSELLTEYYPHILCDYYESHLKFMKTKSRFPRNKNIH
ncbi:unnamed protein product [Moneuplotes crassus]|uniref:Chromo domain-containing protein n=1 Tax=Euplotes crassus TaxID=5936 RepID=A0AAD1XTN5_EUPCR|nr:unnamed protein product [Moneuplotes crassus]